jgi:hypothetical protein
MIFYPNIKSNVNRPVVVTVLKSSQSFSVILALFQNLKRGKAVSFEEVHLHFCFKYPS